MEQQSQDTQLSWWRAALGAAAFFTRLPIPVHTRFDFRRAAPVLPVLGVLIGACIGGVNWLLLILHVPAFAASALAVAAGAWLTGALHEDGLADTADGFGGGKDRAQKLAIMDDSRIGTFGVLALVAAFATKVGAIATLDGAHALLALIAAHAGARGILPVFAASLPTARRDGLAVSAGKPSPVSALTAAMLAVAILFVALPPVAALVAALLLALAGFGINRLSLRQIGGYTGDVLGALEQVGEVFVLVAAAALLR